MREFIISPKIRYSENIIILKKIYISRFNITRIKSLKINY